MLLALRRWPIRVAGMAKKKIAKVKRPAVKKAAAKPAKPKGKAAKKPAPAKALKTAKRVAVAAPPPAVSLGRPRIPGDSPLYLLFKEDFQARQVFAFLGVETVSQLEAFGPKEILKRITLPLTETVERIRRKLAENNRCLAEDASYAIQVRAEADE